MKKRLLLSILAMLALAIPQAFAQVIDVENVIDVTDTYITNPSFETGDMTGWTIEAASPNETRATASSTEAMTSKDGNNICYFHCWGWAWAWNENSISQNIKSLPAGTYMLTCVTASENNVATRLYVNGLYTDYRGVGLNQGKLCSAVFKIDGTQDVNIKAWMIRADGLEGAEGYGEWQEMRYKVDNFHLYKLKDASSVTDLLDNPSYEKGYNGTASVVNAFSANTTASTTGSSRIYKWTTTRTGGTTTNTYFGTINASNKGGNNGSRMNGNSGGATPLHGSYCALIRRGNNEATHKINGNSDTQNDTYSNGSGTLSATTGTLSVGTYTCTIYYKMAHIGTGDPTLTLTATPQSGRGTAGTPSIGTASVNTGLVERVNNYKLNGSWNDIAWNAISTSFTMTASGTATISIEMRANSNGARAANYTSFTYYYAYDTEALVDYVSITKISSPESGVQAGTEYYFQNCGTGQWLSAGGSYGTHATADDTGMPVNVSTGSMVGYYYFGTPFTADGGGGYLDDKLYCDGTATDFQLQESKANAGEYYILTPGGQLLSVEGKSSDYQEVELRGKNIATTNSANTRWKMYTRAQRITALKALGEDETANATFLIDNANFDRRRTHDKWNGWGTLGGNEENHIIEFFNTNFDFNQKLTDLPKGHYALRVQGYYRPGVNTPASPSTEKNALLYASNSASSNTPSPLMLITDDGKDVAMGAFAARNTQLGENNLVYVPDNIWQASQALTEGYYDRITVNAVGFSTGSDNVATTIGVKKTETIGSDWTVIDNFRLYYSPLSEEEALEEALKDVELPTGQMYDQTCLDMYESNATYTDLKDHYKNKTAPIPAIHDVLVAFDDISSKVADAKASIEDYKTIAKYRTGLTQGMKPLGDVPQGDYLADGCYTRYADGTKANAYVASGTTGTFVSSTDFFTTYKAFLNQWFERNGLEDGSDLTGFIYNQGFEFGDTEAWAHAWSADTGARSTSDGTYAASGSEGSWLFNTWWQGVPLTQTITDLPNGKYTLQANLTSDNGANLFLIVNDNHSDVISISGDKGTFYPQSIDFEVTDGTVKIGVAGGNDEGVYVEGGHWWYKADDFRLILRDPCAPEDGTYYLYNKGNGQYLGTHGGAASGTQAMTDAVGLDFGFAATSTVSGTFDSQVYSSGKAAKDETGNHWLYNLASGNVYLDGASTNVWRFGKKTVDDVQYYYLKSSDGKYLTAGTADAAVSMVDKASRSDNSLWQLKTRDERIAELTAGTATDASFLIRGNDFTRGDRRVYEGWTTWVNDGMAMGLYSTDAGGYEEGGASTQFRRGGWNRNYLFECWHHAYYQQQEVEDIPNGVYTLTAQCFDGEDGSPSRLYGKQTYNVAIPGLGSSDVTVEFNENFPRINGWGGKFESGDLSDAMQNATIGQCASGAKIKVVDGKMTLGFGNTGYNQWSVIDNLRMTYHPFTDEDVQEEMDKGEAWLDNMYNVATEEGEAFKIPEDEIHRAIMKGAISIADGSKGSEEGRVEGLKYLLAAISVIPNYPAEDYAINPPAEGVRYCIRSKAGTTWDGNVLTMTGKRGASEVNAVDFQYSDAIGSVLPQAITFEAVEDETNTYRMSYVRGDGKKMYLSSGAAAGTGQTGEYGNSQVRAITEDAFNADNTKALKFRILTQAAGDNDRWQLRNTLTNTTLGNYNNTFYTGNMNANIEFVEAPKLEIPITIKEGWDYTTLILPYSTALAEGMKAYRLTGVDENRVVILDEETGELAAHTPYLLETQTKGTGVSETAQEYAAGYSDESFRDGLLVGAIRPGHVMPLSDEADEGASTFVLSKQGGKVAFFRYSVDRGAQCVPFKAYVRVDNSLLANRALIFPGGGGGEDAVEDVLETFNGNLIKGIYDLNGLRHTSLQKGTNILRMKDGTVRKVMVK